MSAPISYFSHRSFSPVDVTSVFTSNSTVSLNVSYQRSVSRVQLWKTIAHLNHPKVIFWYIGANGFKTEGAKYYQKDLERVHSFQNGAECILYDLTAWAGLRKKSAASLTSADPNVERINSFAMATIQAIASSDYFQWLKELKNKSVIHYVANTILQRDFIYANSEGKYNGLKIQTAFREKVPVLEPLMRKDCANSYSALQYIEALYLVLRLVNEALATGLEETNIVFALPDDEWKYYFDESNSFYKDAEHLLKLMEISMHVNIEFCTFEYGPIRPYNAGKETIGAIDKSLLGKA